MAKIAKNIKQFRNERDLSQETLAESIHVTRQTVSSWETGRTQPDIEMIETLAGVFDISVEELIYGKKNRVGFEAEKKPDRKGFIIALTLFGSLLTAIGIGVIFVTFWEEIRVAKNVLAFLPLLVGFAFSVFALIRKPNSAVWRESGAVAWTVGLIVTNALINSLNAVDFGFGALLLLDTLLLIPVILLTRGLIPMGAYFVGLSAALFSLRADTDMPGFAVYTVLSAVLLAVGFRMTSHIKKDSLTDTVFFWIRLFAVCFNAVAAFGFAAEQMWLMNSSGYNARAVMTVFAVLFFIGGRFHKRGVSFFGSIPLPLLTVFLSVTNGFFRYEDKSGLVLFAILFVCLAVSAAIGFGEIRKDPLRLVSAAVLFAVFITDVVLSIAGTGEAVLMTVFTPIGLALALIYTVKGFLASDIRIANVGMISSVVIAFIFLFELNIDRMIIGAVIASSGVLLLAVNRFMLSRLHAEKEEVESHE